MKIAKDSYVSVSYTLTVEGQIADKADATKPLEFIFGMGMLLPKFEKNLVGKAKGETVKFTLTPEDGYGEQVAEAIVELPKDIFMVDEKLDEEIVKVGAILPMMDDQGNQMPGKVLEIKEECIVLDFNSPMAGKTLDFEVTVEAVRESNADDMAKFSPQGGGCGCNEDCGDGCCDEGAGCNSGGCNC